MRHNALQKKYKNEHMDSWRADMPPTSPSDGGTPQTLQQKGKGPHKKPISLRIAMHREPTMKCGGVIKWEASPNRGGVRELSQNTFKQITTPPQHANAPKPCRCTEEHGGLWGMCTPPRGAYKHMGVYEHMGVYDCGGCPNTPQV